MDLVDQPGIAEASQHVAASFDQQMCQLSGSEMLQHVGDHQLTSVVDRHALHLNPEVKELLFTGHRQFR